MSDAPATPAPASNPYSPVPGAAADLAPHEITRSQIEALKKDETWLQAWANNDPAALRQLQELQVKEHEQRTANGNVQIGGPSPEFQRHVQADTLAAMGLPASIVEHFRTSGTVIAVEKQQAVEMWNAKKEDPEWVRKLDAKDFKTRQEYGALLEIRCSRVVG